MKKYLNHQMNFGLSGALRSVDRKDRRCTAVIKYFPFSVFIKLDFTFLFSLFFQYMTLNNILKLRLASNAIGILFILPIIRSFNYFLKFIFF